MRLSLRVRLGLGGALRSDGLRLRLEELALALLQHLELLGRELLRRDGRARTASCGAVQAARR